MTVTIACIQTASLLTVWPNPIKCYGYLLSFHQHIILHQPDPANSCSQVHNYSHMEPTENNGCQCMRAGLLSPEIVSAHAYLQGAFLLSMCLGLSFGVWLVG